MSNWDAEWGKEFTCPSCGTSKTVPAYGPENAPYLIIGAYPGDDEVKAGRPMVGPNGTVLKQELARNNYDLASFRLCNLWLHIPPDKKPTKKEPEMLAQYEACFNYGAELAIKEAIGRKAILLIGSDTVKFFCGMSVEAYNGLLVPSSYLSAPVIMACIQPATVFKRGGVGEFKLSIKKWTLQLEKIEHA